MSLRIEILKYRGHAVSRPTSVVFGTEGGTVGRSSDNRLVLPDECISRKHARISYEDGRYYLIDNSSNGTQIVNRDIYVQGESAELMDGDILQIGDYELNVSIDYLDNRFSSAGAGERVPDHGYGVGGIVSARNGDVTPVRSPFPSQDHEHANLPEKQVTIDDFFTDSDEGGKSFRSPLQEPEFDFPELKPPPPVPPVRESPPDRRRDQAHEPAPAHRDEPSRKTGEGMEQLPPQEEVPVQKKEEVPEPPPVRQNISLQTGRGVAADSAAPPARREPTPKIDAAERLDSLDSRPVSIPPVQEPMSEAPAPDTPFQPGTILEESYRALFQHFLKGARLDDPALLNSPELPKIMEEIGSVFREMAQGLWTVLKGRMELKAEFRLAMTMIRPSDNNPLKLSPTVEDAVKNLIKRLHPSFMEPAAAVREGFEDVMNHQIAMNAGLQASLTEAFERFNPEHLSGKMKNGLFGKKGKYWEAYRESFGALKEQALDGIFGKAFIRAYEEQLQKLRTKKSDG